MRDDVVVAAGLNEEVIGRADELAAIDRLCERAAGTFAALVFEGEPGIGKTALWNAGRTAAAGRGFRVLSSRPARSEAQLPLGVFGDLFAEVPADLLDRLPSPQRQALEVAFLRADPEGVVADQRALSVATLGLVRLLVDEAPLLLAVDDVQWLDESSAAILAYVARRAHGCRAAMLLTLRAGTEQDPLALETAVGRDVLERRAVGPLSLAALHRLFEARLQRSFPRLVLTKIESASAGNPFFALEVGRALVRRGTDVTAGEPLPVPDSLATLTAERIATLPDETRHALLLAATAPVPTLETLADAGVEAPARTLEPAVREGIVSLERSVVRFAHPLLANATLASVDEEALRELHLTLARSARSDDVRAHHLGEAASGPEEVAASALEAAALQARARGASLDAVSLYERASALTPDPEEAMRRAVLAAEGAFIDLGDLHYADALLGRALEGATPGAARAEAMSLRALVWYFAGRQTEATSLCEEALAESPADGVVRVKILLRCAYLHGQVDMRRSVVELAEAGELLDREPGPVDPDLLALALLDGANAALQMAEGFHAGDVERAARLHRENGRSWEWDRCEMILYELARHTDDLEVALARLYAQIERRADRGVEDPFRFVHAALINAWLGHWPTAREWAERAIDAYSREGGDLYDAFALRGLAFVEALEGNVEEARRLSREGLELTTRRGDVIVAILHRGILGFTALSTGDVEEADRQLGEAARLDEQLAVTHPFRSRIEGDHVEAALGVGDVGRAERIVERLERVGADTPTPWTLAIAGRTRGLVEAARGDLDAGARALERALEEHDRLPMPFERARTLLVLGRLRRRLKQKRRAREALEGAAAIFEELGAALWAERARHELRRVATRRAPTTLTPTEEEIARLASEGLTNSAIAERVFVSVKTVEANLRRAYRKLGITSRAQLARALDEQASTPIS